MKEVQPCFRVCLWAAVMNGNDSFWLCLGRKPCIDAISSKIVTQWPFPRMENLNLGSVWERGSQREFAIF